MPKAVGKRGARAVTSHAERNRSKRRSSAATRRGRLTEAPENGREGRDTIKGTRLSFSSAMGSDQSECGGTTEESRVRSTATSTSPTTVSLQRMGSAGAVVGVGGAISGYPFLQQRPSSHSGSRARYATSQLRVPPPHHSPSTWHVSRVEGGGLSAHPPSASALLAGMKRDRSVEPLLRGALGSTAAGPVERGSGKGVDTSDEGGRRFCRTLPRPAVSGNEEEEAAEQQQQEAAPQGDRMGPGCDPFLASALPLTTPPRTLKKPRRASPPMPPGATRESLGLSSLSIGGGPAASAAAALFAARAGAQGVRGGPAPVDEVSTPVGRHVGGAEEEEADDDGAYGTQTAPRRCTPHSPDEAFPPDEAVRALRAQEPPTATREVRLRPGYELPSPATPLWAALEEARGSDTAAARREGEEAGEADLDIFALEWSPVTVPRASVEQRPSAGEAAASPSTTLPQQQQQTSMLLVGDEGDSFMDAQEETGEADLPHHLVGGRQAARHVASTTTTTTATTTISAMASHSARASTATASARRYQTAGVSIRGGSSRRRAPSVLPGVRGASALVPAAADRRSMNLLDPDGWHDSDGEPFFPTADSAVRGEEEERGSSMEAVLAALTERERARAVRTHAVTTAAAAAAAAAEEEGEAWISLTQEAARLDGVEQGYGAPLTRGRPRGRVGGADSARNRAAAAQQRLEPLTRDLAAFSWGQVSARRPTPSPAAASVASTPTTAPSTSTVSAAAQARQAVVAGASQPLSARAHRMLDWAEQTRGFFRRIDERPLKTVTGAAAPPSRSARRAAAAHGAEALVRPPSNPSSSRTRSFDAAVGLHSARAAHRRTSAATGGGGGGGGAIPQLRHTPRRDSSPPAGTIVIQSVRASPASARGQARRPSAPDTVLGGGLSSRGSRAGSARQGLYDLTPPASVTPRERSSLATVSAVVEGGRAPVSSRGDSSSAVSSGAGSGGFSAMIARAKQRAAAAAAAAAAHSSSAPGNTSSR